VAPRRQRTRPSLPTPAERSLNANLGHYAFVTSAYATKVRPFVDLSLFREISVDPSRWSSVPHFAVTGAFPSDATGMQVDITSIVTSLEYAAAVLMGSLSLGQADQHIIWSKHLDAMLEHVLTEHQLHLNEEFAPWAENLVSSMLCLSYYSCFTARFHKWRRLSLEMWDIVQRFRPYIKMHTYQRVVAMLLGTEPDEAARAKWMDLCSQVQSVNASAMAQGSLWSTLSTLLPKRLSPSFSWSPATIESLQAPSETLSASIQRSLANSIASIESLRSMPSNSDVEEQAAACRFMVNSCEALCAASHSRLFEAQTLAQRSLREFLSRFKLDSYRMMPSVPFFSSTCLFICALVRRTPSLPPIATNSSFICSN
jgi:hypothetical protein